MFWVFSVFTRWLRKCVWIPCLLLWRFTEWTGVTGTLRGLGRFYFRTNLPSVPQRVTWSGVFSQRNLKMFMIVQWYLFQYLVLILISSPAWRVRWFRMVSVATDSTVGLLMMMNDYLLVSWGMLLTPLMIYLRERRFWEIGGSSSFTIGDRSFAATTPSRLWNTVSTSSCELTELVRVLLRISTHPVRILKRPRSRSRDNMSWRSVLKSRPIILSTMSPVCKKVLVDGTREAWLQFSASVA